MNTLGRAGLRAAVRLVFGCILGTGPLAAVACGTSSTPSSSGGELEAGTSGADGGAQADSAAFAADASDGCVADGEVIRALRLGANDECFPGLLPACGCRVLLDGVDGGCSLPGFAAATPTDVASLEAVAASFGAQLPPGAACVLSELSSAGSCSGDHSSGWCFVQGSCNPDAGATCQQALCASAGFFAATGYQSVAVHPAYVHAWLACP